MAKLTTRLKCGKCETGIVRLIVSKVKDTVTMETKNCDKCKAFYGLKGIQQLDEAGAETAH